MGIRKDINTDLLGEIKKFRFFNNMSVEEFAEFFDLKSHKLRNWKNSMDGNANPTIVDLRKIDKAQRSIKGQTLKYKINLTKITTGQETTIEHEEAIKQVKILEDILKEKEIEIIRLSVDNT